LPRLSGARGTVRLCRPRRGDRDSDLIARQRQRARRQRRHPRHRL